MYFKSFAMVSDDGSKVRARPATVIMISSQNGKFCRMCSHPLVAHDQKSVSYFSTCQFLSWWRRFLASSGELTVLLPEGKPLNELTVLSSCWILISNSFSVSLPTDGFMSPLIKLICTLSFRVLSRKFSSSMWFSGGGCLYTGLYRAVGDFDWAVVTRRPAMLCFTSVTVLDCVGMELEAVVWMGADMMGRVVLCTGGFSGSESNGWLDSAAGAPAEK